MPVFGASDLDALLRDTGVVVQVGATTGRGLEDAFDEEQLQETMPHIVGRVRRVLVKTGAFVLAIKGAIMVDGTAYLIHSLEQVDDGALTRVWCVAVT